MSDILARKMTAADGLKRQLRPPQRLRPLPSLVVDEDRRKALAAAAAGEAAPEVAALALITCPRDHLCGAPRA